MAGRKVVVLGGGNGSFAAAADLALRGHSVRMWSAFPQELEAVARTGIINYKTAAGTAQARIDLVTDTPAEALKGAEAVIAPSPAFAQPALARAAGPHLEDGQVIFLSPGSLGSYLFASILKENGHLKDVAVAEPGTLPYLTRKVGPDQVEVSGTAVRLPVGVFPARKTDQALSVLQALYPAAHPVENALSVALLNVGPIIHSVLVLLNLGPIQHFPAWDIHNEGTQPLVKKLILAHDDERVRLRQKLGFTSHHYPFGDHYDPQGENVWMYGRKAHVQLVKSEKWRERLSLEHRYIQEDVKQNLALLTSLGRLAGEEMPIANSLLKLYGALLGEDLRRTGRSLESLGLGDKSLPELTRLLEEGF